MKLLLYLITKSTYTATNNLKKEKDYCIARGVQDNLHIQKIESQVICRRSLGGKTDYYYGGGFGSRSNGGIGGALGSVFAAISICICRRDGGCHEVPCTRAN